MWEDPTTSTFDFVILKKTRCGFFHRDTKFVVSILVELYREVLFFLLSVEQIVASLESDAEPICRTRVTVSKKLYQCSKSSLYLKETLISSWSLSLFPLFLHLCNYMDFSKFT